jgi:hypothetical protein
MAKGDIYDNKEYVWQVRALTDGTFMIRYDTNISSINKGRYNTSSIVSISVTDDVMTVTTKSGSKYMFRVSKCAFPMHLLNLTLHFGVEF